MKPPCQTPFLEKMLRFSCCRLAEQPDIIGGSDVPVMPKRRNLPAQISAET
jgi:hypothetical protein